MSTGCWGVLWQSFSLTTGMRDSNSFPQSTWILSTFPAKGDPPHTLWLAWRPSPRTPCHQSPQRAPATHHSPCRAQRGTLPRSASRQCRCGSSNAPACSAESSPPPADSSRPGAAAAPTRPQRGAIRGAGTATPHQTGEKCRCFYKSAKRSKSTERGRRGKHTAGTKGLKHPLIRT